MGHALALLLLAGLALAIPNIKDTENRAFANIGGTQYFIGNEIKLSWFDAAEFCNALGLSLAGLEKEEENTDMKTYLVNNTLDTVEFWTSGHKVTGGYIWTGSGVVMAFTDWAENQPDETGLNSCLALKADSGWWDNSCLGQRFFLCQ